LWIYAVKQKQTHIYKEQNIYREKDGGGKRENLEIKNTDTMLIKQSMVKEEIIMIKDRLESILRLLIITTYQNLWDAKRNF